MQALDIGGVGSGVGVGVGVGVGAVGVEESPPHAANESDKYFSHFGPDLNSCALGFSYAGGNYRWSFHPVVGRAGGARIQALEPIVDATAASAFFAPTIWRGLTRIPEEL